MQLEAAKAKLRAMGQEHVLQFWDRLTAAQREGLLAQVAELDAERVADLRALLASTPDVATPPAAFEPAPVTELDADGIRACKAAGEAALRAGKVGVVLVAGGQGSRLGYEGPKGCYVLGPLSGWSLFEIHARKILALERRYAAQVPLYVMTSQSNDAATRAFFAGNACFGLASERVHFFSQGMLPALTSEGKIILEAQDRLFLSPDGHGGILLALERSGMFRDMARRGVTTLFYFQVDNALVHVADPVMIGFHVSRQADATVKVCAKRDAQEPIGVVVVREGRTAIVEYSELTPAQMEARRPDGQLLYRYGSVAIHAFSRTFLESQAGASLPYHLAHKKIACVDANGAPVAPGRPNGYKFERFIFDVLPAAARAELLAFDRAEEFAPLKNATGPDSVATAQADMTRKFAGWLRACGVQVPTGAASEPGVRIEIDPCYALDSEDLCERLPIGFAVRADTFLQDPGR